ncbi:AEC family transporter [Paenibacillus sp. HN-1]|uniref:AEC family transporter n=1 Tax=Paenibacillus TaxID=44249 RepID=UPI001CA98DED|nr:MULTISPECIES: AEC family transporter [Paenibacillus]MBY9082344.1 AEC family transporter [Paenibacillus sp. CGMCC 1.18879]MBY9086292.1 AEC family transporter [Paenibacillus sinensis]
MIGEILLQVVLPVFVLIGAGSLLQRLFRLDLYTLAKINFYYITPAAVFMSMYQSEMSYSLLGTVVGFYAIYIGILYALSFVLTRVLKYKPGMRAAFTNSVMLDNSGNYGMPVNSLAFHGNPLAASLQSLIMTLQALLTFTYGVMSIQRAKLKGNYRVVIIGFLKMPVPYALVFGLLLHAWSVPLPAFLLQPLTYAQQSMVALALFTLGAQIMKYPIRLDRAEIYLSLVLRLLAAPMIGVLIVLALGIKGIPAQALMIASGMPTGVNASLLAEEYNNEPDFAAQTVLISTLVNVLTITGLIALVRWIG